MGSSAVTCSEPTSIYSKKKQRKVGVLKALQPLPLDRQRFLAAMPETLQRTRVLDLATEPGRWASRC